MFLDEEIVDAGSDAGVEAVVEATEEVAAPEAE